MRVPHFVFEGWVDTARVEKVWMLKNGQDLSLVVDSSKVDDKTSSIGFGLNSDALSANSDYTGYTAYDMRLQAQDGDTSLISNVPLRLTAVQYSSDTRIKHITGDVDGDDLLQRMQQVQMKTYTYTDAWRQVRRIPDIEVRGVIAQELREVFPEHVQVLNKYSLPDKNNEPKHLTDRFSAFTR